LGLLLRMRLGRHTREDLDLLASRRAAAAPPDCVSLFCCKDMVQWKNEEEMALLPGLDEVFGAMDNPVVSYITDIQAFHLLENGTRLIRRLRLRVGAHVTVPTNSLAVKDIAAGSRGVVAGFSGSGPGCCVSVRFLHCAGTATTLSVGRVLARVATFGGVGTAATRCQIPLVLSWAATVHGAHGWTLDRMAADLGDAFAPGQVVSALSRTRRLWDVFFLGFYESKVLVDRDALEVQTSLVSPINDE